MHKCMQQWRQGVSSHLWWKKPHGRKLSLSLSLPLSLSLSLLARSLVRWLAPLLAPLLALESMLRTYASLNSTEPVIWHCSPALKGMLGTYSSLKQRLNQ